MGSDFCRGQAENAAILRAVASYLEAFRSSFDPVRHRGHTFYTTPEMNAYARSIHAALGDTSPLLSDNDVHTKILELMLARGRDNELPADPASYVLASLRNPLRSFAFRAPLAWCVSIAYRLAIGGDHELRLERETDTLPRQYLAGTVQASTSIRAQEEVG